VTRARAAPRCPVRPRWRGVAARRTVVVGGAVLAVRPGQAPEQADDACEETPAGGAGAGLGIRGRGVDGAGPDLVADPVQAAGARLDLVRGRVQRPAYELGELVSWRALWAVAASCHKSCSSAERRAIMPRAVWLFTAPRLMPMVAAISASLRSA
jgi:hypothetical protein